MTLSSIISMTTIVIIVIGGFVYFLSLAIKAEARKKKDQP